MTSQETKIFNLTEPNLMENLLRKCKSMTALQLLKARKFGRLHEQGYPQILLQSSLPFAVVDHGAVVKKKSRSYCLRCDGFHLMLTVLNDWMRNQSNAMTVVVQVKNW